MEQQRFRALAGGALVALVIATSAPRLVGAQPTPTPVPAASIAPNATNTLAPASEPTSMPYPAYGSPAPGVNSGVPDPNVPHVISLNQAIAIGYATSPLLAQARAQLEIAAAPVNLAKTAILPNISGSASTTRSFDEGGTRGGATTGLNAAGAAGALDFTSNNLSLQLKQLIFDGGKIAAQYRAAKDTQNAQIATYKRELQTVAYNVATAYYNSLAAQRATAVAVQTVQVNLVNEQLVQAQIRAGSAAKADLSTAELPTAQARVAVVRAQGNELTAEATFANALGLDANTLVLPKDDTPVNGAAVVSTVAIPTYRAAMTRAIAMRPDISSANFSIESYRASLRAAKLGLFPTLNGSASTGTSSTNLQGGAFRNASNVGLTLTVPLFDQGITRAQTEQAQGNLDLAIANQRSIIQGVQLNVKSTLVGLVSAKAALVQASAELAKAQDVLRSTQAQYKAGVTTLPLLLSAQVGLTQALTDDSTAVYTLRQAEQAFLFAEGENGAP